MGRGVVACDLPAPPAPLAAARAPPLFPLYEAGLGLGCGGALLKAAAAPFTAAFCGFGLLEEP